MRLRPIFGTGAEAWRAVAIKAVEDESELPGTMPDEMWEAIRNDRDACEAAMRIGVRLTKAGIRDRILSAPSHELRIDSTEARNESPSSSVNGGQAASPNGRAPESTGPGMGADLQPVGTRHQSNEGTINAEAQQEYRTNGDQRDPECRTRLAAASAPCPAVVCVTPKSCALFGSKA